MKRVVLFLVLAGGGLALLAAIGGGFLGPGAVGEHPEVKIGEPPDPSAPGIDLRELDPAPGRRATPPVTFRRSKQFETSGQEWREWLEPVSGERFVYPVFVPWTFGAGKVDPTQDPFTGDKGVICRDIRVHFFRDPATRAEAEALRANPNARSMLVQWEITGEEGRADFVPAESTGSSDDAAAGAGGALPRGRAAKSRLARVVHLTKAVRLVNAAQRMTLQCTDLTVDLSAGTAIGRGEILADFPTYVIHGRGMKIDRAADSVEIEEGAVVDVKTAANEPGALYPMDIGAGEFRPKRLSTPGGAVVTRFSTSGESGLVVHLTRRVHMDEEGGGVLDADAAELTAVRASAAERPADAAPRSEQYKMRSFIADGHVEMTHPGGEGRDRYLEGLSGSRLSYQVASSGPGLTQVDGPGWATYHGTLAMPGAVRAPGTIRVVFQKGMRFGPAGQVRPEAPLRLLLEGRTSIEHALDDGSAEADRVESDRLDVFLRRGAAEPSGSDAPHAAPLPTSLVPVGFLADGDVRLSGPHVSGTADRLRGEGLDQPGSRLVAEGTPGREAILRVSNPGAGQRPLARSRAAGAAGSGSAAAPGADAPKATWVADSIGATEDVRVLLRNTTAVASRPVVGEAEHFWFRSEEGARLTGGGGRDATLAMVVGPERTDRVVAPTIHYGADGSLRTEGRTHAEVWSGGRGSPAAAHAPDAASQGVDVVDLRSGSRIEIEETPQAGADYLLRLTGGGSLAFHRANDPENRLALSARSIDVAIAERAPRPVDAPASGAPTAGRAATGRAPPTSDAARESRAAAKSGAAKAEAAPVLWKCDCGRLSLAYDPAAPGDASLGALRSLVAEGSVVAASDVNRIRGERFEIEGTTHEARLAGRAERPALLWLGAGERAQRIASADMDFSLAADGRIEKARIAGRFVAVLHPSAEKGQPAIDHVDLVGDGDLWVTADGAVTDGHTIARGTPAATRAPTSDRGTGGRPWTLSTPHLEVAAPGLLAGGNAALRSLTASGDVTRIDMGSEAAGDAVAAVGNRLVYDAATSIATITGKPHAVLIQQGKSGFWKTVRLDLKTGLPDFEGGRLVIEGGPTGSAPDAATGNK